MSDTHSNAYQKLSDLPLEHLSDFDWNRCPTCFRTSVRHELESLSDFVCSTHPGPVHFYIHYGNGLFDYTGSFEQLQADSGSALLDNPLDLPPINVHSSQSPQIFTGCLITAAGGRSTG